MSPITRNKKRKYVSEFDETYHSPSSLKNYILDDPVLDFLKKKYGNTAKDNMSSVDFILEEGNKFETDIISELYNKSSFPRQIYKISNYDKENKLDHYETTKKLIEDKIYDVILNGLLINDTNCTYGYPDLIVKGSWILKTIETNLEINIIPSIYYIIDIKSSTINLINNEYGKKVGNKKLYKMYKSQIYIYMKALEQIQKVNINYGFILGKSYSNTKNNKINKEHNPFKTLGVIDFNNENTDYDELITKSINWKNNLNKNWHLWDETIPSVKELYPNMKNKYDYPYKKIKKDIALNLKEITLLWNCGLKHRNHAFDNNIFSYDHPKLNSKVMDITKSSAKIIDNIIDVNRNNKIISIPKDNNMLNWRKVIKKELYVDFETYNYDNKNILYMIGIGEYTDKWNFKCLYIGDGKCNNEYMLLNEFINYIKSFRNYRLIHWSNAEPSIINKKIKEYNITFNDFKWFDLLKVFKYKNSPIVIKDAFNFSLKEITKALNKNKLLNLEWCDLDDGLTSLLIARDIYTGKLNFNENMKQIIDYNEIDCKAMFELLQLIRNKK